MQGTNAAVEACEAAEIPRQVVSEKFGQILSSGLPSLYRGAYRLLGNAADAEDAVQDALLSAWQALGPVQRKVANLYLGECDRVQQCPHAIASPAASGPCLFARANCRRSAIFRFRAVGSSWT